MSDQAIAGLEKAGAESRRWKAADLIDALRRHHEPPPSKPIGGYFVTEIQAPNSTRRADALWLPVNSAARGSITGYETKVTRADVVQELRDPMKADAWQKYCDYWYLVIPNGAIIDGLDIPDSWGIMMPPLSQGRRTMTVVRKAPRLEPQDPRTALGTVLAKLVYGGDSLQQRLAAAEKREQWIQTQLVEANAELRSLRALTDQEGASIGRIKVRDVLTHLDRLSDETGSWVFSLQIDAEAVAAAMLAAGEAKHYIKDAYRTLDQAISNAQHQIDGLKKVREAIA